MAWPYGQAILYGKHSLLSTDFSIFYGKAIFYFFSIVRPLFIFYFLWSSHFLW